MKHRVHKFNFKGGKDANDMLIRKLAVNFLEHGKMVTTEKKGRALSSFVARLVEKAKTQSEANKNYLLKAVSSKKVIDNLFENVGPTFKDVVGGYITLKRMNQRSSDGTLMVRLAWVKPVVTSSLTDKDQKERLQKPAKGTDAGQVSMKTSKDNKAKTAKADKPAAKKIVKKTVKKAK